MPIIENRLHFALRQLSGPLRRHYSVVTDPRESFLHRGQNILALGPSRPTYLGIQLTKDYSAATAFSSPRSSVLTTFRITGAQTPLPRSFTLSRRVP